MTSTCKWVDEDGNACTTPTARKWCTFHRAAAAAARQAKYRERQAAEEKIPARSDELPAYISKYGSPSLESGRTIPGVLQPSARIRVPDEHGVVDYTKADSAPRQASQERQPRRDMRGQHDFQTAASMRAGARTQPTNLEWWAELAELGEEGFLREQNRRAMQEPNEPHEFDVVFTNRWNQRGYVDPTEADMADAPWSR